MPLVVFAFSKRQCEAGAQGLGGVDLNSKKQKSEVIAYMNKVRVRICV